MLFAERLGRRLDSTHLAVFFFLEGPRGERKGSIVRAAQVVRYKARAYEGIVPLLSGIPLLSITGPFLDGGVSLPAQAVIFFADFRLPSFEGFVSGL